VEADLVVLDGAEVEGKKIEEQSALGLGGQPNELAIVVLLDFFINVLDIGRFAAQAGAVINDLKIDFSGGII